MSNLETKELKSTPVLQTPDISPAQLLSMLTAIVGLVVSLGFVDNDRAQAFLAAASVVVPIAWIWADALIRHGRSRALLLPPKPIDENETLNA